MKKLLLFFMLTGCIHLTFAQTEKHKETFKIFKEHFNAGNYENIFNLFSTALQKELPLLKTNQLFNGIKSQAGNIKEETFLKYENSYAVYKTFFDKAILLLNISIDDQNKINGLYIKPYVEAIKSKLVNNLLNYPEKISRTIYIHSNGFPNKTQLSIAFIKNNEVTYYGVLIENDSLLSIENQNKIFEIGSITKVFTSTVFASLIIDNKIKLNDHINKYYPFPFKDDQKISFLSLSNHTSGLPRLPDNLDLKHEINPYKNYGVKEINYFLSNLLNIKNDSIRHYEYSNTGAGLLGYTLGISQQSNFNTLLQKRIFEKYKMTHSFTSPAGLENQLVSGFDKNGKKLTNWEFDVLFGAGGILSTTEDLVKFAQAQFNPNNKVLALTRQSTFTINEKMKIGLGWHILKSDQNDDLIWHNGATAGYTSSMLLNTEKKNGIIILSNVSAFHSNKQNIDNLIFELIKMM